MTAEEKEKENVSWNDVKEKYLKFHGMDKFTENMAIDIDFGYSLANEVIKEAMRWRDPKEAPQNTDMLVKYTIVGDIFDYACLEKDCDDTWHWRGEEWDVNKYPIIGWRPIE